MKRLVSKIEDEFSGDLAILRVIFANKDPLIAYHMLKTEISYATVCEFLEYLDVYESLKEVANEPPPVAKEPRGQRRTK